MFTLHPTLDHDCTTLGHFPLSRLLLLEDANYPWFILVPEREGVSEIHQLSEAEQQQLMRESSHLSAAIATLFDADKINVAALGNVVAQLHIHHIVRYHNDPAWPSPVWGHTAAVPYSSELREQRITLITGALDHSFTPAPR